MSEKFQFREATVADEAEARAKKRAPKRGNYGEPWDITALRHALDDEREERSNKRKAAEEAKQREQQEEFRLTALPPILKAKAHADKQPVVSSEIIVGPICNCRSFRYPHFLEAHKALRDEWDWRTPEEREADDERERESNRRIRAGADWHRYSADRVRDQKDRRKA